MADVHTVTINERVSLGNKWGVFADVVISTYAQGGAILTAAQFGLVALEQVLIEAPARDGYLVSYIPSTKGLIVYQPRGNLNLATPAFSGVGLTAAGQVMTTTDNQTMTLNQCAGMWLIPVTGATPPMLILSNTAVTGAPAVLTVQGAAGTNAGTYKIVSTAGANSGMATEKAAGAFALTVRVLAIGV